MANIDYTNVEKAGGSVNPPSYQTYDYPVQHIHQQTFPPPYGVTVGQPMPIYVAQQVPFLGHQSASIICPSCHAQIFTRVDYVSGTAAWVICLVIALFGGIFGCCLIPFCIDSLKDAYHHCPNCNVQVGTRRVI